MQNGWILEKVGKSIQIASICEMLHIDIGLEHRFVKAESNNQDGAMHYLAPKVNSSCLLYFSLLKGMKVIGCKSRKLAPNFINLLRVVSEMYKVLLALNGLEVLLKWMELLIIWGIFLHTSGGAYSFLQPHKKLCLLCNIPHSCPMVILFVTKNFV